MLKHLKNPRAPLNRRRNATTSTGRTSQTDFPLSCNYHTQRSCFLYLRFSWLQYLAAASTRACPSINPPFLISSQHLFLLSFLTVPLQVECSQGCKH
jgi:hypothetical protein